MCPSPFENKLFWQHELNKINSGVPRKRKNLQELLNMEVPSFLMKEADQKLKIPMKELKLLADTFNSNPEISLKIFLPFVFLQQGDSYKISGSKYEAWAIERLLDFEESNFIISIKDYKPKNSFYYAHQVNKLRRNFPTLVQVVYSI